MNILFDINHPVDVNFFKNTITQLSKEGHKVIVTYRPREKLKKIIEYELREFSPIAIGHHYKKFIAKVLGQLYRDFKMFKFQKKQGVDLSVCFGPTNAIASKLNRIPYLAFEDDFEYKIPFYHANIFATRHIMPNYIRFNNKKTFKYNGFKELAYLHPKYFCPNTNELRKYSINPNEYVFIRDISNVSLNYKKSKNYIFPIIEHVKSNNMKIIISLEDNYLRDNLSKDCIILKEPVEDIYSLMKYSLFVISSGDTMASESCLLGSPCIYTGGRGMLVNKELLEIGEMFKEDNIE